MNGLTLMWDKQVLKRIPIKATSLSIGRHEQNDVVLPDRTISAYHAKITMVREDCFLEDLGSTNGTYVNQLSIDRHLLVDGDVIGIGKYHLLFHGSQNMESQLRQLSIHPKLLDGQHGAWLQIVGGKHSGYVIPLGKEHVVLGRLNTGQITVGHSSKLGYTLHETNTGTDVVRTLTPGEEFTVGGIVLRFFTKDEATSVG